MTLEVAVEKTFKGFKLCVQFAHDNDIMGVLGASGSGKSMTLKCIAGIETPQKGRIVLNGRVLFDSEQKINLKPQERKVGYLFQNYALFPNMTVEKNIACALERVKGDKQSIIDEMIERFQLNGLAKRYPLQLSGGQQQRVALARIMAYDPEALLLDEPFSALDAYLKDQLQEELLEMLSGYPGSVIMVTHSRDEVYRLCSKLLVIDHGQAVSSGNTKEIFADPQRLSVARLTGCKNFSRAQRLDDQTVEAIDWQIRLKVKPPFPENFDYIGIRAHDFYPWQEGMPEDNRLPCHLINRSESPFEKNIIFTTVENVDKPPRIWWLYGRYEYAEQLPQYLGIAPENILLLSSQQPTVSSLTAAAQQLP
mgnify:CR=1 FL=1